MVQRLPGPGGDVYGVMPAAVIRIAVVLVLLFGLTVSLWVWFDWRIEVDQGRYAILVAKTGEDLTNDQLLTPSPEFKGIEPEVLREGRHFRNPYSYDVIGPLDAVVIPSGKVGVLVRRFGTPLPDGEIVARAATEKGIVADPLQPGRHYVNTLAYDVTLADAVSIKPGYVGVVVNRAGSAPKSPNTLLVEPGERGIQRTVLQPGLHYLNPHVSEVVEVDVRSQKFEMSGPDYSILFPSLDGFQIRVDGTVEWAVDIARLPELFVKFVDIEDAKTGGIKNVESVLILPFSRGYARLVGSTHPAVDFISGETRSAFQTEVFNRLKSACEAQGVIIRSVVVRNTTPPEAVRLQYQAREIAKRQLDQYKEQIKTEQARIQQKLNELSKERQSQFGTVRQDIAGTVRKAEENRDVKLTQAQAALEVARTRFDAAKKQAQAIRDKGLAEAAVVVMQNTAEALALQQEVTAFGDGATFARYKLLSKLAPAIRKVLSNTDGAFAELFKAVSTPAAQRKVER